MKREIKFRAWLPAGTDIGDGEIEKGQMCYDLAFEEYEPINDLLRGVDHLMQYTGLKDKNGKEIYEGDILKEETEGSIPFAIEWEQEQWVEDGFVSGFSCLSTGANCYEVIGNIWENPELLEAYED